MPIVDNTNIVPALFTPAKQKRWGGIDWRIYTCNACGEEIDAIDAKTLRDQARAHLLGSPECAMESL